jgi:hypothetical protein
METGCKKYRRHPPHGSRRSSAIISARRSTLQRNERVKLAASFWNNVGAGMVIGGMAGAFFLDKPPGAWTKIGIAMAGLALGWLCYSIASTMLTYMHTAPEERR